MSDNSEVTMAALEQWADFVAALAGMRAQLVNDGWTDEQARELVLHSVTRPIISD